MMENYFNIFLEFDREKVNTTIQQAIENNVATYVCSVDGNNLISANENPEHRKALNNAMINLCDSAWIPLFINFIYCKQLQNYTGADLFLEYIKLKRYRQFFLGSTPQILKGLKNELSKIDPAVAGMCFESLPFKKVEEFDYPEIAKMINNDNPDIIWVSLGAPKQEQFMYHLRPFLNRGVMFGFGAIFNFNSGIPGNGRAPRWIIRIRLEWLFRTFQEPERMVKRYWHVATSLPKLIREEIKKKNKNKKLVEINIPSK
jgi:N-acetylglucosaminyldiphosphoundecaprenol N-acetyl-beta-D-mannosaminyltransferase